MENWRKAWLGVLRAHPSNDDHRTASDWHRRLHGSDEGYSRRAGEDRKAGVHLEELTAELEFAYSLLNEDPDEAHRIASDILREDPDNAAALFLIGVLLAKTDRQGYAIPIWQKVCKLKPNKPEAWNNLGNCLMECRQLPEARHAFERALSLKQTADYCGNIAVTYNEQGNYEAGTRWAKKALQLESSHAGAQATLGFAKLAQGDWSGWRDYEAALGGRFRNKEHYARDWNGKPVDTLVIYGEQGLGDEIMYASCFEDAYRCATELSIECDHRLEALFSRSFPFASVHGTRRLKTKDWGVTPFDAQCAAGSLPSFFRPSKESCPKKPYLIADPVRRLQWRALFESYGKPVIGLAWTGGSVNTRRKDRAIGLETFRPLIESTDAVFVSLQYQDPTEEIEASGLDVKHFPWVNSQDYDDTAALVAELDDLIGPPTTVHHLAGALGKKSTILVPSKPMWDCATGDSWAWYQSQTFFRQRSGESWADCIKRLTKERHD